MAVGMDEGLVLYGGPLDGCYVSPPLVDEARRDGNLLLAYRERDLRPLGRSDVLPRCSEPCGAAEYVLITTANGERLAYVGG